MFISISKFLMGPLLKRNKHKGAVIYDALMGAQNDSMCEW